MSILKKKLKKEQIDEFLALSPLIKDVLYEVKELSKKKQDEFLNKLKVKSINRILIRLKELLKNEPLNDFLDLLNEDELPTNSDAVIIIVQYETALQQFKKANKDDFFLL